VPGDGIFTAWSYRAGAGRAEAFLLRPRPLRARTAYEWGVVTGIVQDGEALARAIEFAYSYLKVPEVTRRNTRVHFTQPLKDSPTRSMFGFFPARVAMSHFIMVSSTHIGSC
jgi:enoyl-CoA hydratase/carnithine racemase